MEQSSREYRAFELFPNDGRKSFYGKAVVFEHAEYAELYSYNTRVAVINFHSKRFFYRLWIGYSATTQRHINAFCNHYGFYAIDKKEWESRPIHTFSDALKGV